MGPTLARLAKRAAPDKHVIGVARFSEKGVREELEQAGVETIAGRPARSRRAREAAEGGQRRVHGRPQVRRRRQRAAHLGDERAGAGDGGRGLQGLAHRRLLDRLRLSVRARRERRRDRGRRRPMPPSGDYANSCVGRERMFEYFSAKHGTPGRLFRLNYAIDMRYGVLHDIGRKVRDGETIDLTMGHANVIWQGDANSVALRCLAHATTPTTPINVTGPETFEVAKVADEFGRLLGKKPKFTGKPAPTGWINNAARMVKEFGPPSVPLAEADRMDRRLGGARHDDDQQADALRSPRWHLLRCCVSASTPNRPKRCGRCRSRRAGTRTSPTGASCWAPAAASACAAPTAHGRRARWCCRWARGSPGSAWCW